MITADFQGGLELEAALAELGDKATARRTGERALKRAAEPIQQAWAGGVDVVSSDLKRSIKIGKRKITRAVRNFRKGAGADIIEMYVGVDASEGPDGRLPIYSVIEEFGDNKRPANPAGRRAFDEQAKAAVNRLAADLKDEIEKTAARAARKTARLEKRGAKLDANADALRSALGGGS